MEQYGPVRHQVTARNQNQAKRKHWDKEVNRIAVEGWIKNIERTESKVMQNQQYTPVNLRYFSRNKVKRKTEN